MSHSFIKRNIFIFFFTMLFCFIFSDDSYAAEDFGDAPNSYGNTARHTYDPNLRIGNLLDTELTAPATPGTNADQDNLTGANDEDGLAFIPSLNAGRTAAYSLTVNVKNFTGRNATLVGWIDFNIYSNKISLQFLYETYLLKE